PALDGFREVTAFASRLGELLYRGSKQPLEACAFTVEPGLKFGRIVEVKAVQERARIHSDRAGALAPRQELAEITHIARDELRVQAKLRSLGEDCRLSQLAPKDVDCRTQQVARPRRIAFRPEVSNEFVPAHRLAWCSAKQCEQRQSMALQHGARDGNVAFHGGA